MSDQTSNTAPVKQNPMGLDVPITIIQNAIAEISWIDLSYGRAWPVPDSEGRVVPAVYTGNRQHKVVLVNDYLKSHSFIYVTSPERVIEYQMTSYEQKKEVDIALIVWVNFEKIDKTATDFFMEELKSDIESALVSSEQVISINIIQDQDANSIFAEFNINVLKSEKLMWPYGAMRFDCTIGYETNCYTT